MQGQLAEIREELLLYVDEENIETGCLMKNHTTFKIGGPASLCVFPGSIAELFCALEVLGKRKVKHVVIGNGSNVLFPDEGYEGVVLKIGKGIDHIRAEGNIIFAEAGALLSNVAKAAAEAGLTGMEFAAGIPGSLGGAVYMNAGAYGGDMCGVIHSVSSIAANGMMKDRACKDLSFAYRKSIFQTNAEIVLGVKLKLKPGDKVDIEIRTREYNQQRTSKQPLHQPSAGSFFRRPEGHFAGGLIQEAGLKGLSCGGAQISALHAGFIVNTGNATAADILNLMRVIQETVWDRSGIFLEPEVKIIS
ncbi:MAG: UDP-N-acetylmuramate dehydrogenase [Clostridia bacterium]|nr:UDP-N-acetylmuramate dehydrogenase [Clostridia bacterium]